MIKHFKKMNAAAMIALVGFFGGQAAFAATGSTTVTINLPDIIILHYYNNITLDLTGVEFNDVDESAGEGSGGDVVLSGTVGSGINGDVDITTELASDYSTISVSLTNAWAVRGITGTDGIDVSAVFDGATASLAGGGDITGSGLVVIDASGTEITDPIDAPGLATPTKGGLTFDLDLRNALLSGSYTGMGITLTAEAL